MLIIPTQGLDEIVTDHFGSDDAQTQSSNDEAELFAEPKSDWSKGLLGSMRLPRGKKGKLFSISYSNVDPIR